MYSERGRKMIVSYKESNYYTLLQRGVPKSVLASSDFDISNCLSPIEVQFGHKTKLIRSSAQLSVYEKTLKQISRPYLYVIGGKTDNEMSKAVALSLMDKYLNKCIKNNEKAKTMDEKMRLPIWHTLYSNLYDKLRDSKDWITNLGLPGFLVIETLYENGGSVKLDKTRDLLAMFSDIPRVVLVAGIDPISFCRSTLYCQPNKVMYFEDSFELQTQQI